MAERLSYDQFAAKHGLVTDYDVLGHIHGGLRAAHMPKTFHRWYQSKLGELQAARDNGEKLYAEAIKRGEVEPPEKLTLREQLEKKALGNPDLPSTQAAIRTLERIQKHDEGLLGGKNEVG